VRHRPGPGDHGGRRAAAGLVVSFAVLLSASIAGAAGPSAPQGDHRTRLITPPTESAHVIQAGREQQVIGLLADPGFEKAQPGGWIFDGISIDRGSITMTLHGPDKAVAALITLRHVSTAQAGQARSASFAIAVDQRSADASAGALVGRAVESIKSTDTGDFYVKRRASDDGGSRRSLPPWGRVALLLVVLAGLAGLIWLRLKKWTWDELATVHVKPTHLLPAAIQVALFAYWALYWRELPPYLTEIGLQILFAYALDIVLGLALHGRWKATAGPIPVVGSANLFVQFHAGEWALQYGIILVAMLGKSLLVRNGRHVLNPSAFGIAVIALINLAWPSLGLGDIAHQFDLPPNMTEVILLLAVIIQLRVPVVLISIGCMVGLLLHGMSSPEINFSPFWSPVALVAVLLATDPATSPRTGVGKLLFGATFGLMIGWTGEVLVAFGHSDFYGKVLPLPVCNLMVPLFDRMGLMIESGVRAIEIALRPRLNLVHMLVFFGVMSAGLFAGGKSGRFITDAHAMNETRFLIHQPDGALRCKDNPLFCRGFTFAEEIAGWMAEDGGPGACGGAAAKSGLTTSAEPEKMR